MKSRSKAYKAVSFDFNPVVHFLDNPLHSINMFSIVQDLVVNTISQLIPQPKSRAARPIRYAPNFQNKTTHDVLSHVYTVCLFTFCGAPQYCPPLRNQTFPLELTYFQTLLSWEKTSHRLFHHTPHQHKLHQTAKSYSYPMMWTGKSFNSFAWGEKKGVRNFTELFMLNEDVVPSLFPSTRRPFVSQKEPKTCLFLWTI